MVSGSLCPCPEGRVMWRDGRPLMCLLHCTGMWGWWGLVDNTEAIAALQSPPFCVMGADRDQMGHKCAPKLPGRCTLWYTLRDLSSDHLDRGTCWTSDMESGNGLDRHTCIWLLRNAFGSHSSDTASDTPVSSHPHGELWLSLFWFLCLLCWTLLHSPHGSPRPLLLAVKNCTLPSPGRGAARLDVALSVQRRWVAGDFWVNEMFQKQSLLSKDNIPPSFLFLPLPPVLPYSYSRCFCFWKDIYHFSIFNGRFFPPSLALSFYLAQGVCVTFY